MLFRRLRWMVLGRRWLAATEMVLLLAVGLPAANRATELKLGRLRHADPEAYLEELHRLHGREAEWLRALQELHPERYAAKIARREAEERQRREQEAHASDEARRAAEARRQEDAAAYASSVLLTSGTQAPSAITTAGWQFQLANDPMDRTQITEAVRQSDDSGLGRSDSGSIRP